MLQISHTHTQTSTTTHEASPSATRELSSRFAPLSCGGSYCRQHSRFTSNQKWRIRLVFFYVRYVGGLYHLCVAPLFSFSIRLPAVCAMQSICPVFTSVSPPRSRFQIVVFTTDKGAFEAEIYCDKMPITAGAFPCSCFNFAFLSSKHAQNAYNQF